MRVLAVLILVCLTLPVVAQQNVQPPSNPGGITYEEYEEQITGGSVPPPAPVAISPSADRPTRLGYTATDDLREALGEAIYQDHMALLDYNRRVFQWQMTSTIVTFWMVIALVLAGLVFAWVQFWRAMKASAGDPKLNTDLELSGKGLKVSSPVLGVIILTISLGFFYLYLRHVYPIEYVRGAPPPEAAAEE